MNTLRLVCLGGLALGLSACSREDIRVYEAPKGPAKATSASASAATASTTGDMSAQEHLHWDLPDGWEETSSSGVRTATFRIKDAADGQAEVAIMTFRKMGGGDLQFVNLWRSTLGLPEVGEEQLSQMVEDVQIGEDPAKLYDVMDQPQAGEAPPDAHIIVAMVVRGETSWFFKLAGDAHLVSAEKETFKTFLKSITFHQADAHEDNAAPAVASSTPAPSVIPEGPANPAKPSWTVPEGWQEVPPTSMLLAKFTLTGGNSAQADVTVSVFPGDVGGLLANVNRWRSQVGQPPIDESGLRETITSLDVDGQPASLVDVSGTSLDSGDANRLIGVIVPRGSRTWFFKMMGNAAVAGEQKDAFLKFLNSIQFPNA